MNFLIFGASAFSGYFLGHFVGSDVCKSKERKKIREIESKDHIVYEHNDVHRDGSHEKWDTFKKYYLPYQAHECDYNEECKKLFDMLNKCFPGEFEREKKIAALNKPELIGYDLIPDPDIEKNIRLQGNNPKLNSRVNITFGKNEDGSRVAIKDYWFFREY